MSRKLQMDFLYQGHHVTNASPGQIDTDMSELTTRTYIRRESLSRIKKTFLAHLNQRFVWTFLITHCSLAVCLQYM